MWAGRDLAQTHSPTLLYSSVQGDTRPPRHVSVHPETSTRVGSLWFCPHEESGFLAPRCHGNRAKWGAGVGRRKGLGGGS